MRILLRLALVSFVLLLMPAVSRGDCKYCAGAYCRSVADMIAGWDSCLITTSRKVTICGSLNPQVCVEITTTCTPIGDRCTNMHTGIIVNGDSSSGCTYYNNLNNSGGPCPFWM